MTQPTISDGCLAPIISQQWLGGLVVWGTPEKQIGSMISANSLVGSHLFGSIFAQMNKSFEFVFTNTDWIFTKLKLSESIYNIMAHENLKKVKLGLIGNHAPGFLDLHPHPFLINKTFGCIIKNIGLSEFFTVCDKIPKYEIKKDIKSMFNNGWGIRYRVKCTKKDLEKLSRTYLGLKYLIIKENFDGLAIRCWPEFPRDYGVWPLMGLARLASQGFPITCEGDIDGCLGCICAKFLGAGVIYLSDILEYDVNTLTLWHAGMAPEQLSEDIGSPLGPCIARHFNNFKPGILDAVIKAGICVTIFRLWVCNKKYYLAFLEGETIDPKREDGEYLMGNSGKIIFSKFQLGNKSMIEIFEDFIYLGMPHHCCVVQGHFGKRLTRLAQKLGIKLICPDNKFNKY